MASRVELRISRYTVKTLGWTAVAIAALVVLYALGSANTPADSLGNPVILSPSVRDAEAYTRRSNKWLQQMETVDESLASIIVAGSGGGRSELYYGSEEIQDTGELASALVQEIAATEVPLALASLREMAMSTASAYLDAAVLTARWYSTPSDDGRRASIEALRTARVLRIDLEDSRWLQSDY